MTKEPLEAVLETCDDSLKGKRDRALLLFARSVRRPQAIEVSEAVFETCAAPTKAIIFYTLANSKTNHGGKVRPEDVKPVVGMAAEAMKARSKRARRSWGASKFRACAAAIKACTESGYWPDLGGDGMLKIEPWQQFSGQPAWRVALSSPAQGS